MHGRRAILQKHPGVVFLLPFVVFLLVGALEPTPAVGPSDGSVERALEETEQPAGPPVIAYRYYPAVYTAKIVLTVAAMLFVLPGYRAFPFRVSVWAVVMGIAGAIVWVGICRLELERRLLERVGLDSMVSVGARSAYDPFEQLGGHPGWAWAFLAVRFFGLAVVVAVIEEFFLRGFVMRFVIDARWWSIPFGQITPAAAIAGTLLPVLSHPAEMVAAAVWFSMVTWLMVRTRNIWDCVVAHAVTNGLMGVYVVLAGEWSLL